MRAIRFALFLALSLPAAVRADAPDYSRTQDVIYAKRGGVALTMDVFTPKHGANGAAVILVVSGGWFSAHEAINPGFAQEFLKRGYTVFAVVHGSQPKYTIPEILPQMHRAVRFIRYNAAKFHIDPNRIGITGGSAGGHLSLMQGTAGDAGDPKAADPVDRVSSRVQAVACFFPPTDFLNYGEKGKDAIGRGVLKDFRAAFDVRELDLKTKALERLSDEAKILELGRAISPIYHITAQTPPTLIIHGDQDKLVPIQQAETFLAKLKEAGVPAALVVKKGAAHGWAGLDKDLSIIADWFDKHLAKDAPAVRTASILPTGAKLEKVWGDGEFTEGPAYGPDHCVYFSDIGNRIMRYDPASGKTTVFREPSGRANGLDFDAEGRLVACEGANTGGSRRVTRTEKDGSVKVLAERWQGKRFNSPNDLTIDAKGRIYFTDPRYVGDEPREIETESVYRIDRDGSVTQLIADVQKPNGIILAPDMKTLYLADSNPNGNQHLLSFPLLEDGSVGPKRILHDFGKGRGIDGMVVDVDGNIYAAAGSGTRAGIYVFDSNGKLLTIIPTPEDPSNCVFGDRDHKSLYLTAGKSLYRIKLDTKGFAVYWPN